MEYCEAGDLEKVFLSSGGVGGRPFLGICLIYTHFAMYIRRCK